MAGAIRADLESRFWSRVQKTDDCWLWMRAVNACGYGVFGVGTGLHVLAHRAAWHYTNGPIPDGLFVLHRCDNPRCVRPEHLFLGTQHDNVADMVNKGRHISKKNPNYASRGTEHYRAKLDPEKIAMIQALSRSGRTQQVIADRFGVTPSAIAKVLHGVTWHHLSI